MTSAGRSDTGWQRRTPGSVRPDPRPRPGTRRAPTASRSKWPGSRAITRTPARLPTPTDAARPDTTRAPAPMSPRRARGLGLGALALQFRPAPVTVPLHAREDRLAPRVHPRLQLRPLRVLRPVSGHVLRDDRCRRGTGSGREVIAGQDPGWSAISVRTLLEEAGSPGRARLALEEVAAGRCPAVAGLPAPSVLVGGGDLGVTGERRTPGLTVLRADAVADRGARRPGPCNDLPGHAGRGHGGQQLQRLRRPDVMDNDGQVASCVPSLPGRSCQGRRRAHQAQRGTAAGA
jgi:hypothetical protein